MPKLTKAEILRQRFGKRITLKLSCRIVTPMFLGNAEQEAALRPEPFKGLLRYWWRVAAGRNLKDPVELLTEETKIFGGGGEEAQKSLVTMEVEGNIPATKKNLPPTDKIYHPEAHPPRSSRRGMNISPLCYLAGMGLTYPDGQRVKRSYLAPEETFTLKLTLPASFLEDEYFKTALLYLRAFGAIGSRSRNGWGSFQVIQVTNDNIPALEDGDFIEKLENGLPDWEQCFDKEYPHSLAKSKLNEKTTLLLWKEEGFNSWQEAMKFLAEVYIYIRTGETNGHKWPKQNKLDPDADDFVAERHLLGFPLTHHPAQKADWGKKKKIWNKKKNRYEDKYEYKYRLASPLRFFVKEKKEKYYTFVLHLPYFVKQAESFLSKRDQIKIWQKVHQRLDQAMQRANINDCL